LLKNNSIAGDIFSSQMETNHKVYFTDSRDLERVVPAESIDLIVTSPPYPMIEMWDDLFSSFNCEIKKAIKRHDGKAAFEFMHYELDKVWEGSYRTLKSGGLACINIGDATRKIGADFRLYSNHSRIISKCMELGFDTLPLILWKKQTNAPNKFMGSGMLPAGAYVTLEHEYIIILRKNGKRIFRSGSESLNRAKSSFFWEERNAWFSDIWDFKGVRQDLDVKLYRDLRKRSAAFPFELPVRLINMYSCRGDTVLDPFAGTGGTLLASMAFGRNSVGIEIDKEFKPLIFPDPARLKDFLNFYIRGRLDNHIRFSDEYKNRKGKMKYLNKNYNFPVMTRQETEIIFNYIDEILPYEDADYNCVVRYFEDA
jgi:modification methylase